MILKNLVIKRKEAEFGTDNGAYVNEFCEILKVFNQTGMQLMNAGRHNGSQEIFRALIRFIKAQEMKRVDPKPQISTMLILTLNNLGCCYKR
jgi:hypothetical protein